MMPNAYKASRAKRASIHLLERNELVSAWKIATLAVELSATKNDMIPLLDVARVLLAARGSCGDVHGLYAVFGLEPRSSASQVKKMFQSLALKVHPDRNSVPRSEDAFKLIRNSFEKLRDLNSKFRYDEEFARKLHPLIVSSLCQSSSPEDKLMGSTWIRCANCSEYVRIMAIIAPGHVCPACGSQQWEKCTVPEDWRLSWQTSVWERVLAMEAANASLQEAAEGDIAHDVDLMTEKDASVHDDCLTQETRLNPGSFVKMTMVERKLWKQKKDTLILTRRERDLKRREFVRKEKVAFQEVRERQMMSHRVVRRLSWEEADEGKRTRKVQVQENHCLEEDMMDIDFMTACDLRENDPVPMECD